MNYLNSMPYLAGHGAREQSRREWVMHVAPIRGKIELVSQNQDLQKDIDETHFLFSQA